MWRQGAALVAAYLLLTVPLLLPGGVTAARTGVLTLHLGGALALFALASRHTGRSRVAMLADWAPLLLLPFLYAELPLLMEGLPGPVRYHDPALGRLEALLFGGQPVFTWSKAWREPFVSELLHACYVSYYLLIYVPPVLLYLGWTGTRLAPARREDGFHETVLALTISFLTCFLVFVVLPVQGPRYLGVPEGVPEGVPDGPVRGLALTILETGSSRGAAFPSSHVAVAVTQTLAALRYQPRVGLATMVLTVGLAAGAVYGGFHYLLDVLAGAVVGMLALPAARVLRSGVSRQETGFSGPPAPA